MDTAGGTLESDISTALPAFDAKVRLRPLVSADAVAMVLYARCRASIRLAAFFQL